MSCVCYFCVCSLVLPPITRRITAPPMLHRTLHSQVMLPPLDLPMVLMHQPQVMPLLQLVLRLHLKGKPVLDMMQQQQQAMLVHNKGAHASKLGQRGIDLRADEPHQQHQQHLTHVSRSHPSATCHSQQQHRTSQPALPHTPPHTTPLSSASHHHS